MNDRELASSIIDSLRSAGYRAYLVGGCVRDMLLGQSPGDFDIATSATPSHVIDLYPNAQQVGAHFGVVMVGSVEVATFRSDYAYQDGRRPGEVRFETEPEADARRRDFTINALFLDPDTNEILDFVGGRADLEEGVIRAIGDPETAFPGRLSSYASGGTLLLPGWQFRIEPATAAAIRKLRGLVRQVAAEQVRDELIRILTEGHAKCGFELLDELGLLEVPLPEVARA